MLKCLIQLGRRCGCELRLDVGSSQVERWSPPVQPLWGKPNLSHFRTILDPQVWARFGIKTLREIMSEGALLTFSQLSRLHDLPGWMYFCYAQLRHAARAQFPEPPLLQLDPVEDLLSCSGLEKPLSALYGTLLTIDYPKMDKLLDMWKLDISTLDREDWLDGLEHGPKLVISSGDKVIQIKFLHWVCFTPMRLCRIYPNRDPHCPCCRMQLGTYLHMFWECPTLSTFWSGIFEQLNARLELSVPMSPELALLEIHEDEERPHHSKLLILYLLFYAKKNFL